MNIPLICLGIVLCIPAAYVLLALVCAGFIDLMFNGPDWVVPAIIWGAGVLVTAGGVWLIGHGAGVW